MQRPSSYAPYWQPPNPSLKRKSKGLRPFDFRLAQTLEGKKMTAPIVMHGSWEDNYDDPFHPIPSLGSLDLQVVKKSGGSDLVIVVASPLRADEQSQRRLLAKIEIYLLFLTKPEFQESSGVPTPENTSIIVRLHPASDLEIFNLIERCKPWVKTNNASLRVELLDVECH